MSPAYSVFDRRDGHVNRGLLPVASNHQDMIRFSENYTLAHDPCDRSLKPLAAVFINGMADIPELLP